MKLKELVLDQKIIIQVVFGEQKIEFYSTVLEKQNEGIIVSPYIHNEEALELNIETQNGVVCNLFATDTSNNERVSWKNVKVQTIDSADEKKYLISTSSFNANSRNDDNRKHDRLLIHRSAKIYDPSSEKYIDVMVHDISDYGISFYAPSSFKPSSNQITIIYTDDIDDKNFQFQIDCQIARTEKKTGMMFYGCRLVNSNKDYQMYGFLKRHKKRQLPDILPENTTDDGTDKQTDDFSNND